MMVFFLPLYGLPATQPPYRNLTMDSFQNELLADFGSECSSDGGNENFVGDLNKLESTTFANKKHVQTNKMLANLLLERNSIGPASVSKSPKFSGSEHIAFSSKILEIAPAIKDQIDKFSKEHSDYWDLVSSVEQDSQSAEYRFINNLNELSQIINQDIFLYHSAIKALYKPVFSELEALIIHPVYYARTVAILQEDLHNARDHANDLQGIMVQEKVLVVIMAAIQQLSKKHLLLSESDIQRLLNACESIIKLDELLTIVSNFITGKLAKFAPNVTAIIGPITASQLIIATGSLKQLAYTPSCNLAAFGTREAFSQNGNATFTSQDRQNGYLFHCELVKHLPLDIVRPAMRIISGKIILAARIDLARVNIDGQIGREYASEIQTKIENLLSTPDQVAIKALPIPIETKLKKRGGKRIRKMKERFEMSELRKAQNKMEFGKQEATVFDAFGEEVGLGMSRGATNSGSIIRPRSNTNTNATISKGMKRRILAQNDTLKLLVQEFEALLLANTGSIFAETSSGLS